MIVKGHHDRHFPRVRRVDECQGQIHQMLDVQEIRVEAGEDVMIGRLESRIAPGRLEARPIAVLDDGKDGHAVLVGFDVFARPAPAHALCRDESDRVVSRSSSSVLFIKSERFIFSRIQVELAEWVIMFSQVYN